jgi:hypothetical protein
MRESTKDSPQDRGEVTVSGRCQACGEVGPTVVRPGVPPPNQLCPRCAIENADAVRAGDDDADELVE